jgi:hypothetical protein
LENKGLLQVHLLMRSNPYIWCPLHIINFWSIFFMSIREYWRKEALGEGDAKLAIERVKLWFYGWGTTIDEVGYRVNREEDERFCFRKFNQGDWGLTLATGGFTLQLRRWMVLFLAKACTSEEKLQRLIPVISK